MKNEKLWNRNFSMVVIGQVISLLGSAIVSFALPLHLLRVTGSAAIFGTVMAAGMIPALLLSPFGGMLADRVNRRDIMVVLDFLTCALIFVSSLFIDGNVILTIAVTEVLLTIIRYFYAPAVNSCIPSITADKHLLRANSIVNTVNSVSMLVGPILGGVLYSLWGIVPILYAGAIAFCFSAVMELFIRLPFTRQPLTESILKTVKRDFGESGRFIMRDSPVIGKSILIAIFVNLVISALISIGMPYVINITLRLSSELYGLAESISGVGSLAGGILVGLLGGRLTPHRYHWTLLAVTVAVVPMGLVLLWNAPPMAAFWVISACCFLVYTACMMFSIAAMTLTQQLTPTDMLGKVMALTLALCNCAVPLGQAIYGFLFEIAPLAYPIFLGAGAVSLVIWYVARRVWRNAARVLGSLPNSLP